MRQAALLNAKAPVGSAVEFASDAATKQATASARLRQAVAAWALPQLQHLTSLHTR
jgi:hypothetical protein